MKVLPTAMFFALLLPAACGAASAGTPARVATPAAAQLASATKPSLGTFLTDGRGMTLYQFAPEKDGKIVCAASCTPTWKPLLVDAKPSVAAGLAGKVDTVLRPDGGRQLTYNEWPLYTFSGDAAPGDTNGQGFAGQWSVVRADAPLDADADADGTTPAPTPASATAAPPAQAAPAPQPPVPVPPMRSNPPPAPGFNDGDADNRGGPSDGDGNG